MRACEMGRNPAVAPQGAAAFWCTSEGTMETGWQGGSGERFLNGGTRLLWCRRMRGERLGSRGDGTAVLSGSFAPHSLCGETPQPRLR
jgi:hypothetical protein